jgi:hypothetical protein
MSKPVLYCAVAALNLTISSAGTRPRSLTSMPWDFAHSRTAVESVPLALAALCPFRPGRRGGDPAARRAAPRITLRRQVAAAAASANSEQEFFACLDRAGVLVRKRFSVKNPGQVTGYSVALPGDTAKDGGPVWYGGGKLAADLTWPKLRHRWAPDRAAGRQVK